MAACMWHAKGMKYSAKVRLILRKCQEKYMKLFFFMKKVVIFLVSKKKAVPLQSQNSNNYC